MNRRKFLTHSLTAAASAGIAYPLSRGVMGVNQRIDADIESESDASWDEENAIIAQKYMEKYEIPTIEQAEQLRANIVKEAAIYYSSGAFMGSAYRSANNEVSPDSRRNLWHRAANMFAGGGLAMGVSWGTRGTSELTDPASLKSKYGMPQDKADTFAASFKQTLTKSANAGGVTIAMMQELFGSQPPPKSDVTPA